MAVEPKYHTAEHILTAVFEELYDGVILDTRFKGKKVRLDFRVKFDEPIDMAIEKINNRANEIIKQNLDVTYEIITREEAESRMALRKVPEDMNPIRLVKTGYYDSTPCSGEHVKKTGEIGTMDIRTYHEMEDDTIRLTFMLRE